MDGRTDTAISLIDGSLPNPSNGANLVSRLAKDSCCTNNALPLSQSLLPSPFFFSLSPPPPIDIHAASVCDTHIFLHFVIYDILRVNMY